MLRRQQARVGAADDCVVPLGQQPHRRRHVGIRTRRVGQVEQLATALAAERHQLRPQRVEYRAQPLHPDHACASAAVAGP